MVDQIMATEGDPKAWSVAESRDLVRQALRNERPRRRPRQSLRDLLALALTDRYERTSAKTARNYPRKRQEKPSGLPQIKSAQPRDSKIIEDSFSMQSRAWPRKAVAMPPKAAGKWTSLRYAFAKSQCQ
jgi:hypothetical protein